MSDSADGATPDPVASRKFAKGRVLVAGAVIALLVVGGLAGYAYWQSYVTSPQYSMKMLGKAVADGDWGGFRKYVDVTPIVTAAADAAVAEVTKDNTGALSGLVSSIAQALKPQLVKGMEAGLKAAVESKNTTGNQGALSFLVSPTGKITEAGDTAYVVLVVDGKDIRLTLKDRGDYWQVVGAEGVIGTLSSLASSPAGGGVRSPRDIKVLSDKQVVEAFQAAGIPIGTVVCQTEATDPNEMLGRPGQYIQKANWVDKRVEQLDSKDPIGGTVEVFDSAAALKARWDYLDALSKGSGMFALNQYMYKGANVIVRVEYALTPTAAKQYESVLQSLAASASVLP
jgi:hypothetical protein